MHVIAPTLQVILEWCWLPESSSQPARCNVLWLWTSYQLCHTNEPLDTGIELCYL